LAATVTPRSDVGRSGDVGDVYLLVAAWKHLPVAFVDQELGGAPLHGDRRVSMR
jgi:hypothetical protein